MQKLFLPLLLAMLCVSQTKAQNRLFDQAVQLKTCNIFIDANPFIATTVVEMEFYNPKDQEVEGLHTFQLNRGQVITDFQLELNGKYREGSIEERWKARQAYSKIVGKRIDPALLQMDWDNHYRINIYPIAAKSSRKIKFTITQMMEEDDLKLSYTLPLEMKSATENFNLKVRIEKPASIPYANKGLLEQLLFTMQGEEAGLQQHASNIILDKPISFSISQFTNKPQVCVSNNNGTANFIMRYYPDVPRYYESKPKNINVYWDVSLSGRERNLSGELDFLQDYIADNNIAKTTIFLFNNQMQGIIQYETGKDNFSSIRNYLVSYKYAGSTELGILNFSNVLADVVLLFSDAVNTTGTSQPKLGAVPVNLILSVYNYYNYNYYYNYDYYYKPYRQIIGNTGGSVIDLYNNNEKKQIKRIDTAENFLFRYNAGNIHVNEKFPIKLGSSIFLSGTLKQSDNLELIYGNNSAINKSENYFIAADQYCDSNTYKKLRMLKAYDSLAYGENNRYWSWQDMIVFGLTERVVTPQTSFLVLERIEDYINYKIAPPKELEEKCAEMNYVYKSEYKIKALKTFTEQDALEQVVKDYNDRVKWWSITEPLIDLNRVEPETNADVAKAEQAVSGKSAGVNIMNGIGSGIKNELTEVVVTSAFGIKRTARSASASVQNLSTEQVNVIRQTNINNALAGKVAGAQVRSQSLAKLGAETTMRLRGENGFGTGTGALYIVDGTIMPSSEINPDDIEDYTILQGPAATALFGPDGANGAIVMNRKKARKGYPYERYTWTAYKLSECKDEDYVQEMKAAENYELWNNFLELEKEHKTDPGFYFEMANFFFEKGKTDRVQELMDNAIELSRGSMKGLRLAGFFYEQWEWFDKAIEVYQGILSGDANNLLVKRDLALVYFQKNDVDKAVKTYYSIITAANANYQYRAVQEQALAEMNAIIAMHKNELDISYINQNLVKILPGNLRITVESNNGYTREVQVIEPGNTKCSVAKPVSVNKGRFTGENYYSYGINEYIIKNAPAGKYRITVNAYNNYSYPGSIPEFIRVISFKNFQQANMKMEVKLFDLDNQYGEVELDEIYW